MAKAFDARLGTSVEDLEVACHERLLDARAMFSQDRYAMAVAMAIYTLELQLKVCICRRLELNGLPKGLEFHDIEPLLTMSGLESRLRNGDNDESLNALNSFNALTETARLLNEYRYKPAERT